MKPKRNLTEHRYFELKLRNLALNSSAPSLNPTQLPTMPARDLKDLDLAGINTAQGIKISGARSRYNAGWSVSSAGDINGDGFDDVIIGARQASDNYIGLSGTSYVIFGSASGLSNIDLLNLSSADGFKIFGAGVGDNSGISVSGAGDVNGDGYDDIIIGANFADPNSRNDAGVSYVIFGKASGFTDIDLSSLTVAQGFIMLGAAGGDYSGQSVSGAGDVNGDGYDDVVIGAPYADPNSRNNAGTTYVIFGKASGLAGIDLLILTVAQGFRVFGAATDDNSGISVSGAGDVNGDGYDDIIIGALNADPNSRT